MPKPDYAARFPRILIADCAVGKEMAAWFSTALNLPAVFFPTTDALLGDIKKGRDALVLCEHTTPPHRFELLRAVKKIDPGIPFVFVTATGFPEMQERARREGAAGWISKPFKQETLEALRGYLLQWLRGKVTPFFDGSPWDNPAVLETDGEASVPPLFTVVIATGGENTLAEMFGAIITGALPEVPVRIVTAKTANFSEVIALPELRGASLFVTMINNIYQGGAGGDWLESRLEFIRLLRDGTNAFVFVTSGMWQPDYREKLLQAGANFVEPAPFKASVLEEASRVACCQWQGGRRWG